MVTHLLWACPVVSTGLWSRSDMSARLSFFLSHKNPITPLSLYQVILYYDTLQIQETLSLFIHILLKSNGLM